MEVLEECRWKLAVVCICCKERLHQGSGDAGAGQWLHGPVEHGKDIGWEGPQKQTDSGQKPQRKSRSRARAQLRLPRPLRMPRKLMAYTFTKQVTASAAVSAREAPQRAKIILIEVDDKTALRNKACNVIHSLTKPVERRRGGNRQAADKEDDRQSG